MNMDRDAGREGIRYLFMKGPRGRDRITVDHKVRVSVSVYARGWG